MKKVIGILSILVGVFFLIQALFLWGPALGASQQVLKWMVGGFGWLFIVLGAIAFPNEQEYAPKANKKDNISIFDREPWK